MFLRGPEARNAKYQRERAHRNALTMNTTESWSQYRRLRNRATCILRKCKSTYFNHLAGDLKNDPKKFWRSVSHISKSTPRNCTTSLTHTADEFNNFFLDIPHQIASSLEKVNVSPTSYLSKTNNPIDYPSFQFKPVDESDIMSCLQEAKTHSATGLDAIPMRFLKACSGFLIQPITSIINKSISQLTVPAQLKQARVVPIQKTKGDLSVNNYRPISILPALSKLLERTVYNQFMDHITEHNILSPSQFGFRPGHSTQDALLYASESWRHSIDKGELVGSAFLDLSKAFDCVDHLILLKKMHSYGFTGDAELWLKSYLQDRTQQVCCNGVLSNSGKVTIGVPQGSILGPLLFSMYINDLSSILTHCSIILYADDIVIFVSDRSLEVVEKSLQLDLDHISNWMFSNKLKLNTKKCATMLIGSRQRCRDQLLNITLLDHNLKTATTIK